jgi:hypothetical protein
LKSGKFNEIQFKAKWNFYCRLCHCMHKMAEYKQVSNGQWWWNIFSEREIPIKIIYSDNGCHSSQLEMNNHIPTCWERVYFLVSLEVSKEQLREGINFLIKEHSDNINLHGEVK